MHDLALFQKVIHRAKVFARMAPEDKQYLIESLQKIGYVENLFKISSIKPPLVQF